MRRNLTGQGQQTTPSLESGTYDGKSYVHEKEGELVAAPNLNWVVVIAADD